MDNQPIVIDNKLITRVVAAVVVIGVLLWLGSHLFKTVPVGHVGVATLFGSVRDHIYREGLHIPVHPLYKWHLYDARQKTHKESAEVPSQDQLITQMEVSVQFRINQEMAAEILKNTGTATALRDVHLVPLLRGMVRDQGKTIKRAEDFFLDTTVEQLKASMTAGLQTDLSAKGLIVDKVIIRDIRLPKFIMQAIERKKEREQEAAREKAELERYKTEQQKKIASAQAERQAAEEEAARRRLIADAQAYEIQKINDAVANNPAYIKLEALKALQSISKDPAAKIYFLNSDSPMPLPLMHMGGAESK